MICKSCGRDKELISKNWHSHPDNKTGFYGSCRVCRNDQINNRVKRYDYFYEISKDGEIEEGKIKASNKDKALFIMKIRFPGWSIEKLCTFKYSKQPIVRMRRGKKKNGKV